MVDIENWTPANNDQKKCMNLVLLERGEEIKLIERARSNGNRGYLIVTTNRLLYAQERGGVFDTPYHIVMEEHYENILNIYSNNGKTINIVDNKKKEWKFNNTNYRTDDVVRFILQLREERLLRIEEKEKSSRIPQAEVNVVVVKESQPSKKGKGIQDCPNCGGALSELNYYKLKSGTDVKCEFCNKFIQSGS